MRNRVFFVRLEGLPDDFRPQTLIRRFIINGAGLFIASVIVPGIEIGDWQSLLAGSAIFAIVNALLRPLAMLVSCCLIIGSFGLFILVVNAALLGLTAWTAGQLGLNFSVSGFWSALFGAIIISMVAITANMIVRRPGRGESGESGESGRA